MHLDPIERVSLTISASAVGAAYALAPTPFAAGVAVGAALEAVNLRIQVRAARRMFAGEFGGAGPWVSGFGMRFGLMALGMIGALTLGTDPAGLVVGVSLAVPAVVVWAWRNRPAELHFEPEPALAPDDPSWDRWNVWSVGNLSTAEAVDTDPVDDCDEPASSEPVAPKENTIQ